MKYINMIAGTALLATLAGCCSTPTKVSLSEPVGPCHRVSSVAASEGSLQVYSARERAAIDPNFEEFAWNNDFGRNDFLYGLAHTGYTIHNADGTVFKKVRNARGSNDGTPALVKLPPGTYQIEAAAEYLDAAPLAVTIPVVIEAGQTTMVDLERDGTPNLAPADPRFMVQLFDGRIIGCRAQQLVGYNLR